MRGSPGRLTSRLKGSERGPRDDNPRTRTTLINRRSAGINDLRFGYVVDDDWSDCDSDTYLKSHHYNLPLLFTAITTRSARPSPADSATRWARSSATFSCPLTTPTAAIRGTATSRASCSSLPPRTLTPLRPAQPSSRPQAMKVRLQKQSPCAQLGRRPSLKTAPLHRRSGRRRTLQR